jgi:hypothetical protein
MPIAVHTDTDADFGGGVQTADDGVNSRALFIGVIGLAPESAHIAVGVQLAEGVCIIVAGSHDVDASGPLGRPAQLHPASVMPEMVEHLVQAAIRPPGATCVCERRSQQFFGNERDFDTKSGLERRQAAH